MKFQKDYNLRAIDDLLSDGFNATELRRLCYEDDFKELRAELPEGEGKKTVIVERIIDFAWRRGLVDDLLRWIERERPKLCEELKPHQYVSGEYRRQLDTDTRKASLIEATAAVPGTVGVSLRFEYDVFICHASEDRPIIERLTQDFERADVTYWVDHEQIDPGDPITEKIEQGLRQSKHVLVCLSANLGRSNWVRREYGSILNKELGRSTQNTGRRVIPLKLDDSSEDRIPLLLYDLRRVDYSNATEFNQLLEFLKRDTPDGAS